MENSNAQVQSASAAAMLEEIIVTARRREESMQDLPLSVAALSADAMQAQGINNIDMIGDFIHSLVRINRSNCGSLNFIRSTC